MSADFFILIAPTAGNHNILVTHDAIVRISPAAESISAGHIVIRVFHINSVTIRVPTIYRIALAFDVSPFIRGKRHAVRHIPSPVVRHGIHRHRSRRRIRQRGSTRLRVLLPHGIPGQRSGRVRSIVLLIRIPLGITGVRLDRDSNDQFTSAILSLTTGQGCFCSRIC